MGFLTDLFKESANWSQTEIQSLFQCLMGMAAVDGRVDPEETSEIINVLSALPGAQNKSEEWWKKLMSSMDAKDVPKSIATLKEMHSKKKKHVLYGLAKVAMADGEASPKELKVLNAIQKVLK